jgi:hypothetical protein
MDVKEVLLAGVGLRYEFISHKGYRIGIIARRGGPRHGRAGDFVCLRDGDRGSGAGSLRRRPVPRKRVGSPHRRGGPPAGGSGELALSSTDVQGDHQPSVARHLFDAAGDGVDAVTAAVAAEDLGRSRRVSNWLKPHPAQHCGAFLSGQCAADREHGVDQAGCQQRPQLGRGAAPVDDFQHSTQRGVGEDRRLTHGWRQDRRLRLPSGAPAVRSAWRAPGAALQRCLG